MPHAARGHTSDIDLVGFRGIRKPNFDISFHLPHLMQLLSLIAKHSALNWEKIMKPNLMIKHYRTRCSHVTS